MTVSEAVSTKGEGQHCDQDQAEEGNRHLLQLSHQHHDGVQAGRGRRYVGSKKIFLFREKIFNV